MAKAKSGGAVERRVIEIAVDTGKAAEGLETFLKTLTEFDKTVTSISEHVSASVKDLAPASGAVSNLGNAWAKAAEQGQAFIQTARQMASLNLNVPNVPLPVSQIATAQYGGSSPRLMEQFADIAAVRNTPSTAELQAAVEEFRRQNYGRGGWNYTGLSRWEDDVRGSKWYHGTSTSALESIFTEGILPNGRDERAYASPFPALAGTYAARNPGGGALLEFEFPEKQLRNIEFDYSSNHEYGDAFRYGSKIKPEWISGVYTLNQEWLAKNQRAGFDLNRVQDIRDLLRILPEAQKSEALNYFPLPRNPNAREDALSKIIASTQQNPNRIPRHIESIYAMVDPSAQEHEGEKFVNYSMDDEEIFARKKFAPGRRNPYESLSNINKDVPVDYFEDLSGTRTKNYGTWDWTDAENKRFPTYAIDKIIDRMKFSDVLFASGNQKYPDGMLPLGAYRKGEARLFTNNLLKTWQGSVDTPWRYGEELFWQDKPHSFNDFANRVIGHESMHGVNSALNRLRDDGGTFEGDLLNKIGGQGWFEELLAGKGAARGIRLSPTQAARELIAESLTSFYDEAKFAPVLRNDGSPFNRDPLLAVPEFSRDIVRDMLRVAGEGGWEQNWDFTGVKGQPMLTPQADEIDEYYRNRGGIPSNVHLKYDREAFGGGFGAPSEAGGVLWGGVGPEQRDPFGTYGMGDTNVRREQYKQQLEYMAERRRQQAAFAGRPIDDFSQRFYDEVFGSGYDLYNREPYERYEKYRGMTAPSKKLQQEMYEQMFGLGTPDASGLFHAPPTTPPKRMSEVGGDFYARSIGSRRLYEEYGDAADTFAAKNPKGYAELEKRAAATMNLNQVNQEYSRGLISLSEKEQEYARILEASSGTMDKHAKGAQNMWQASFVLFGVAMAWQTLGQEIEKVSGEKMPSWYTTMGNSLNIASSLGMTGAMLGNVIPGVGGVAGLAIGAGAGLGLGLLGGLAELPDDVRMLNDALDQLGKKDTVATTLGRIFNWDGTQAQKVLELAKSYQALGAALDNYAHYKEQPSALSGFFQQNRVAGQGIEPFPFWEQYNDPMEFFTLDPKAQNIELYERFKKKRDFAKEQVDTQLFNAEFDAKYGGVLGETNKLMLGATNEQRFGRMIGREDTRYSLYADLAKQDPKFAEQFNTSAQRMYAFAASLELAKSKGLDTSAAIRGISAELEKLDKAANAASAALTSRGDLQMRNRSFVGDAPPTWRDSTPQFSKTEYSGAQIDAAISKAREMGIQYLDTIREAGGETKAATAQWSTMSTVMVDVNGKMRLITGSAAAFLQEALKATEVFKPQNLGLSVNDMPQEDLRKSIALGMPLLDQYRAKLLAAGMPVKELEENWKGIGFLANVAGGGVAQFTGKELEALQVGAQLLEQQKKISNAWAHPSIQTVPELNAGNAPQLQNYVSQFEQLLAAQGVQQDPQRFLMFGQNGFMAQFVTSSDAMTLALQLLGEQVDQQTSATKDNTKKSEQLRGHYNIPTEFGYKPPTPWEVADTYKKNKFDMSGLMGPVNYPWMFPDPNGASGGSTGKMDLAKALLGSVPNKLNDYPTTLSLQQQTVQANSVYVNGAGVGGDTTYQDPLRGKGRLSQAFGDSGDFYGKYGFAGHEGTDYSAPEGTPVYPVAPGKITKISNAGNYGNHVWEELANGLGTVLYAHLKEMPNLKVGQQVGYEDQIGQVGNTGNSTGPHAHIGFKPSDPTKAPAGFKGWADPKSFMEGAQTSVSNSPQIQSNTQRTATSTAAIAAQTPAGLQAVTAAIGVSNTTLTQMLSQLQLIRGLLARPQPAPIVNVMTSGTAAGTSYTVEGGGLGDAKYMGNGGYIR